MPRSHGLKGNGALRNGLVLLGREWISEEAKMDAGQTMTTGFGATHKMDNNACSGPFVKKGALPC